MSTVSAVGMSNYLGLLAGDLLGIVAHISRTPALGDSRFMCHICVYCQEVKAGRPITMDNGVTFHWCRNKNVHISKYNGYDCSVRCFNGSLESFPFLLSYTARFLIGNSPLVSCQDPEQNVLGFAFLTLRWLMSYIYGAPILDVSRSHTTTQHSR